MTKSFKTKEARLYWHKSWVIPPIKITSSLQSVVNCFAKIETGTVVEGEFTPVELEGDTQKKMSNGVCLFKQLKFAQTCKQASGRGANFRFRVRIFDENVKYEFLSDEIFVDSKNNESFT